MNKEQLEIAKRIAEIDGVTVHEKLNSIYYYLKPFSVAEYNPFNWSILGPLMVKYEVELSHFNEYVYIADDNGDDLFWEFFKNKQDIPRAILECIIKSKG